MVSQQGLRRPGARDRALARQSAGRAGLGRLRGGRRAPPAGGAFSVHRGAGAAAALVSCRTLRVRVACEVASDFACDLPLLPEEAELPHHYRPRSSRRTA
jgi:hypothetical protein